MEVEAAVVMVRGAIPSGGTGVRGEGAGDQRVPPSTGTAMSFAAEADGSLDSAYEDNFDCGEEAMQRRLLISRILSSPLLFCASPSASSQETQQTKVAVADPSDFIDQTRSPLMIETASSAAEDLPSPLGSGPSGLPASSEASDEDTEDANLELSRADTEVYECTSTASSPGKVSCRDQGPNQHAADIENLPEAAMMDSPCAPDTSEEEEEIGEVTELAKSLRCEVARVLYEMISRVAMDYESLDEDSNDCESCPDAAYISWRSTRPLSGRSVSTDSGVSSVHDDSRISLSSHLSHCSSQSSRSSECASSPAAIDFSDDAAASVSEKLQRRRSSRLHEMAVGTTLNGSITIQNVPRASVTSARLLSGQLTTAPTKMLLSDASKMSSEIAPAIVDSAATTERADHEPPLKVHVTAKPCATPSGGSVTRSHSKAVSRSNNNKHITLNNNNNHSDSNKNITDDMQNIDERLNTTGTVLFPLPGAAQASTQCTARGTNSTGLLQTRPSGVSTFVKPSLVNSQIAFPRTSSATDLKAASLPCRWKDCTFAARKNFELADHISDAHVATQGDKGPFVCLWEACKVFNVPSTLKHWLERHVVKHSRSKPLKCIVDGCPQRFSTKALLEAHVNSHFEKNSKLKNESSLKSQNQLLKLAKRKKLLRQHSKMQAGRKYDFFDACIMHQIKESLLQFAELDQTSPSTSALHSSPVPLSAKSFPPDPSATTQGSAASRQSARKCPTSFSPSSTGSDLPVEVPPANHCPRRSSRRKVALTNELADPIQRKTETPIQPSIDDMGEAISSRQGHADVPSPDSGFDTSDPAASPPQPQEVCEYSAALANAAAAGRLLIPSQHQVGTSPSTRGNTCTSSSMITTTPTSSSSYKCDPAATAIASFIGGMSSRRSLVRKRGVSAGSRTGPNICTRSMTSSLKASSSRAGCGPATPLVESLARAVRTTRSGQRQMLISFFRSRRPTAETGEDD